MSDELNDTKGYLTLIAGNFCAPRVLPPSAE
jgi:hypothetical protein